MRPDTWTRDAGYQPRHARPARRRLLRTAVLCLPGRPRGAHAAVTGWA